MRTALVVLTLACVSIGSAACKPSHPQASPGAGAPTDPRHHALLTRFANAIVARDYAAAHALVAADARASLTRSELEEAFQHYRAELPDQLKADVEVEAYDGEAGLLVPEELRGRIESEGTIHFDPGGEMSGFAAHVWIMADAGEPRVAHLFVGD